MTCRMNARASGFTLIELSVVLFIIALVTGMAISAGISTVASARQAATINKMKAIEQALMAFRVANDRLPCPGDLTIKPGAAYFGIEAGGSQVCTTGTGWCVNVNTNGGTGTIAGTCLGTSIVPAANFYQSGSTNWWEAVAEGALPVTTLGLPKDMMVDGWGNSFRYAVDSTMTMLGAFHDLPINNTCGGITVNDTNGNARSTYAIYALLSHGPNGHGAYTQNGTVVAAGSTNANELTNCHCSSITGADNGTYAATYVQALPSIATPGTATTTFDDIVTYKERWQMRTPWDSNATVYIADNGNNRIRKVLGCIITTVAGNGTAGYSGDGGPATSARLHGPYGVAVDSSGNIYIADSANNRIRKVTASTGIITTIVGNGTAGYSGDGGLATSAELNYPYGVTVDGSGNLYIADSINCVIRKVTATTGIITTFAGNGTCGYTGDNGVATSAKLDIPQYTAVDGSGNVYIADTSNNRIRKVTASTGIITTFAGNGTMGYSGDGGLATSAELWTPYGLALDSSGNLYFAAYHNNRVRKVTASTGIITTFAGNGTGGVDSGVAATSIGWPEPYGIAFDNAGNLYSITLALSGYGVVTASTGILNYYSAWNGTGYSGDGGPVSQAQFSSPRGIAVFPPALGR